MLSRTRTPPGAGRCSGTRTQDSIRCFRGHITAHASGSLQGGCLRERSWMLCTLQHRSGSGSGGAQPAFASPTPAPACHFSLQ